MIIKNQNILFILLIFDSYVTMKYTNNNPLPLLLSKVFNLIYFIFLWDSDRLIFKIKRNHIIYFITTFIAFTISSYIQTSIKPILFFLQITFYCIPLFIFGKSLNEKTIFKLIFSLQYINLAISFYGYFINEISLNRYISIFTNSNNTGIVNGFMILINVLTYANFRNYLNTKNKLVFIISSLNSLFLVTVSTNRSTILNLLVCFLIYSLDYFFKNIEFEKDQLLIKNLSKTKKPIIILFIVIMIISLNQEFFYSTFLEKSIYLSSVKQDITNGRFEIWQYIINNFELFGRYNLSIFYVDGSYFSYILEYGLVPSFLIFFPYFYCAFNFILRDKIKSFPFSSFLLIQLLVIWLFESNFVLLTNLFFTILLGYEHKLNKKIENLP